MNLEEILAKAIETVRHTGEFIASKYGTVTSQEIEEKALNSLVSYVDRKAERMLVEGLEPLIEDVGFVTEEETIATAMKRCMWVIDPLDGTTNFLYDVPVFSISVALLVDEELTIGIVHDVMQKKTFHALKGKGAFIDGVSISVSNHKMKTSLIATGFPYTDDYPIDKHLAIIKDILTQGRGLRRLGSAAIDLAYVACGRYGGFYENHLNIWDVAAGVLLVQEAGGIVTDYSGGENYLSGNIVAGNPAVHPKLQALVTKNYLDE